MSIRFPDEQAVARVLNRYRETTTEVVLRLAWNLGLSRDEICGIKWPDISFEQRELTLPDRTIPIEEEAYQCLRERYEQHCGESEYVVISDQRHKPMQPESISRLARTAMDTEPILAGVRLLDLRYGYILRQMKQHGWPYAARVSGIQASTMQAFFLPAVRAEGYTQEAPPIAPPASGTDWQQVQEVIKREGTSPGGLALWINWELGIEAKEIVTLTWEQVNFDLGLIQLPERQLPMGEELRQALLSLYRSRDPQADPHVLLTPRSKQPYDRFGISRAIRTALVRCGVDVTMQDLRHTQTRGDEDALLLRRAEEQGSITRQEVIAILHVERDGANKRLRRLMAEDKLVRVGTRYYLPGTVVSPKEHYAVICGYLETAGVAYRKELADLLHIGVRQCEWILRTLVREGKLAKKGQRYMLPDEEDAAPPL